MQTISNSYVTVEEAEAYYKKRSRELLISDEHIELNFDKVVNDNPDKKAILMEMGDLRIWIPRSLITEMDENTITVPLWYAENEELEVYEA